MKKTRQYSSTNYYFSQNFYDLIGIRVKPGWRDVCPIVEIKTSIDGHFSRGSIFWYFLYIVATK